MATNEVPFVKSKMFPALHPENLRQLKAVLNHPKVKEAWFHGNGNIYVDTKRQDGSIIPAKQSSDDAKIYINDSARTRPAKFRVKFEKGDPVPADLKAMEDLLVGAYQMEEAEEAAETYNAEGNNFVFAVEDEKPAAEIPVSPDEVEAALKEQTQAAATGTEPKAKGGKAAKIAQQLNDLKNSNGEVQTVQEVAPADPAAAPTRMPVTAE